MGDDRLTIEQLRDLQDHFDLGDRHLVDLQPSGFTIAHTDAERASGQPLEACHLHLTLARGAAAVRRPGVYVATLRRREGVGTWHFARVDTGR